MEQQGYLHLAPSKLRTCAIGPELIVNGEFDSALGKVRILRQGKAVLVAQVRDRGKNMSHTVANLEHHQFQIRGALPAGRCAHPFLWGDAFSFGEGIELADGDVMEIELAGFGRPCGIRFE